MRQAAGTSKTGAWGVTLNRRLLPLISCRWSGADGTLAASPAPSCAARRAGPGVDRGCGPDRDGKPYWMSAILRAEDEAFSATGYLYPHSTLSALLEARSGSCRLPLLATRGAVIPMDRVVLIVHARSRRLPLEDLVPLALGRPVRVLRVRCAPVGEEAVLPGDRVRDGLP